MAADEYREQVASLIDLDEDALLARLGDAVARGVGPLDPDRMRSIGRAWIDAQRDRLRAAVCENEQIHLLRESSSDDRVALAAGLADLVAGHTGKLVAAAVAVLIVRTGLDSYCA